MPPASRDLTGRIGASPELRWPNGAGLAVSIVVNVEEGAVGWHTRSASSVNTRRLLLEEGGFLSDSDCYDDDLPRTLPRPDGVPHVILPYAFDTNDLRFSPGGGFIQAEDFSRYCLGAIDWMLREAETAPRILSIVATYAFPGSSHPYEFFPARLNVESRIDATTHEALAARGHDVKLWPGRTWLAGCVEMVRQEPGLLRAAADPRRPAAAIAI